MCTELTTVKLPRIFRVIASNAFKCCSKLENINLDENMVLVMSDAFAFCDALTEVSFKNRSVKIENGAFIRGETSIVFHCFKDSSADYYAKNASSMEKIIVDYIYEHDRFFAQYFTANNKSNH
jgi:hypothetical protein